MLKLTNTFHRYFICFVIENKNFNVRKFTHFSKGKACDTVWYAKSVLLHTVQLLRENKCYSITIPPFSSSYNNRDIQMSNQPKNNHVCHEGAIVISSDEDTPTDKNRRKKDASLKENDSIGEPQTIASDFRVWEHVGKNRDTRTSLKFKVVSYNVLAQYLLEYHPYLYTECCPRNLKWKVRAARIYDEIMKIAPDILCLQEVQASHISSFFSKFEQVGYHGIYKQKTGHRQDGCAIYFKRSLFEMLEHISVEFNQPELPILNRDNIGIMVKLLPRNFPGSPIVVATTHLLYNPKRTDIRLAQMQVLLAEIDRFSYCDNGKVFGHLPIILTGDFNSLPDSAVIKLLDRGYVSASQFHETSEWKRIEVTDNCQHLSVYLDRQQGRETDYSKIKMLQSVPISEHTRAEHKFKYQRDVERGGGEVRSWDLVASCYSLYNSDYCASPSNTECAKAEFPSQISGLFNTGKLGHSLNLISVYNKHKPNGEEEATTYQDYWVTVDYIYFSCFSSLLLLERLRLPTVSECDIQGHLPNDYYGSDHLVLAAQFELKPYKNNL